MEKIQVQVTLVNPSNQYRPVSCLVNTTTEELRTNLKKVKMDGVRKICQKRYWTNYELKKYNYSQVKMRIFDKEKIAKEKEENYRKIKEEKGWQ